jgi:benzoate transport
MNLRDRIDTSPMSRYQWFVVSLCFLLNALDGYDVSALAFTATSVSADFGLSGGQLGFLLSAGLAGMGAGSLLLAPFGDIVGRRPTVLVSVGLAAGGMLLSATAGSVTELAAWRVVTGLGVGGILACSSVIAAEYSSRRWRGLAIAVYASGFGIGASSGGLVAVTLQDQYGWQAVFVFGGALTALALIVLALFLPESVQFLLVRQPRNAIARINKIAARIRQAPVATLDGQATAARSTNASRVGELFDAANRRATLLLWAAFFSLMVGYYFVNSWTPALLESAGLSTDQSVAAGMMLALGGTVGSLLYGALTSRWDNRRVLVVFAVAAAVAMGVFISTTGTLAVALVVGVLIGLLVQGCMAGLYTLAPTTYDARVRSTGVGWAITVGRVGAMVSAGAAGMLLDTGWSVNQLYIAMAGVMLVCAAAVALTRPRAVAPVTGPGVTPVAVSVEPGP